jgi:predicted Fe-Mo cluster-binding NifX family protein
LKIAVSAAGPTLDSEVDPRFGRCSYFIIVDPNTMEFEAIENTSQMASGGAGIASAQLVASKDVEAVLTGSCGPNAYEALEAAGIKLITGVSGKIRAVIEGYKTGSFRATSGPSVGAHFGMADGRAHFEHKPRHKQ